MRDDVTLLATNAARFSGVDVTNTLSFAFVDSNRRFLQSDVARHGIAIARALYAVCRDIFLSVFRS